MDLIKSAHEAPSKYFIKPIQEKETLIVPLKKLIPWTIERESVCGEAAGSSPRTDLDAVTVGVATDGQHQAIINQGRH